MVERTTAPLTRSEWLAEMHDLSICCADDDERASGDRIRELNALLHIAPDGAMIQGLRPVRSSRLEAMLDLDACESAVVAMFDRQAGFLVSRGGDGQGLATVVLPASTTEISGSGANCALALVGALASSLSDERISPRRLLHVACDAGLALH